MTHEAVRVDGTKWNWVSFAEATEVCEAWKPEASLPVNALWQSMARQAEVVDENWTGGTVGFGELKTDLKINGATFYDVGDLHWEHVQGQSPEDFSAGYTYQLIDDDFTYMVNGLNGNHKFHFGHSAPHGTYGNNQSLGTNTNRYSSKIMRGGDDDEPGVFGAAMNHNGEAASDVSFRCACPKAYCSGE
jgi:hypothetical protein